VADKSQAIRQVWEKRISESPDEKRQAGPATVMFAPPRLPAEDGDFVSYALLKSGPLPPHVDPTQKEQYLSDEVFQRMFKMSKLEFSKLKTWKQRKMKEAVGLW